MTDDADRCNVPGCDEPLGGRGVWCDDHHRTMGNPRHHLDGEDIREIESALGDAGFNATLIEERPPSMVSSSDAPAVEVSIRLEQEALNDD